MRPFISLSFDSFLKDSCPSGAFSFLRCLIYKVQAVRTERSFIISLSPPLVKPFFTFRKISFASSSQTLIQASPSRTLLSYHALRGLSRPFFDFFAKFLLSDRSCGPSRSALDYISRYFLRCQPLFSSFFDFSCAPLF